MAQVRVVIQDHIGGKKTTVELPDDVPMERLLPQLANRMQLPFDVEGNEISYCLDHPATSRRLQDEDTLASFDIQNEDTLVILPQVTAASLDTVRQDRLTSDYTRMKELVQNSDLMEIEQAIGDPPEQYLIGFHCIGISHIEGDEPKLSDYHQVLIDLDIEYPSVGPRVRWITPIFHPNINEEGTKVCINVWYPSRFLDGLCVMLGEMIQYKNYYPNEAYNGDAMLWSLDHPERFPVDERPILKAKSRVNNNQPSIQPVGDDHNLEIKII